jgi:anti-sigma B factor antagonist
MEEVEYMSSAGLRVLVNTQKTCKRYNRGELVLALVPKRIYEALELVGFVRLFKFFDNVLDAVGSF